MSMNKAKNQNPYYYFLRAMVKYKLEQYNESINDFNTVLKMYLSAGIVDCD